MTGVYDGTGNIIDPYSLFDLPSWTIPQASLEDYATNVLGDVSLATDPVVKTDYQKMLVDLVLQFQGEPTQIKNGTEVVGLNVKSYALFYGY